MPREKDPFREYVAIQNDDKNMWTCLFCKKRFHGGATRIKAHLGVVKGRGIQGCEGVNVDVRAEARKALMPEKVMDSSIRGVSEERIEGNFGAALTKTSDLPYLGGRTNLLSAQGDQVSSFTELLELETLNTQQDPRAPLPSQDHQLLDNTSQIPKDIINTMGPSTS